MSVLFPYQTIKALHPGLQTSILMGAVVRWYRGYRQKGDGYVSWTFICLPWQNSIGDEAFLTSGMGRK